MGIPQIGTCGVSPLAYDFSRRELFFDDHRHPTASFIPRGRALFWEGEHQAQKIEIVGGGAGGFRLPKTETGKSWLSIGPAMLSCQLNRHVNNSRPRQSPIAVCSIQRFPESANRVNPAVLSRFFPRPYLSSSP